MTRSMLLIVGSALWLALGAVPALADNGPHISTAGMITDRCAGCHRLHTAKAAYVLVEEEPALCYTCHGTGGTGASTNVVDGLGYGNVYPSMTRGSAVGALRGGGFSYALIDSANPTGLSSNGFNSTGQVLPLALSSRAAVTSRHDIGVDGTAWGSGALNSGAGATVQLLCTSCHDPHGGANTAGTTAFAKQTYRILKPIPGQSGATDGVAIKDATTKTYTTGNYWKPSDPFSTGSTGFLGSISDWCAQCHTRYWENGELMSSGTGDAIYAYRHVSNAASVGLPNCIQCHVAHGSNATMGTYSGALTNPDGTPGTPGDSRLLRIDNRGTCQMCHNR